MEHLPPQEFGPLCNATLLSLAWEQDGRDLAIQFKLGDGHVRRFVFTWVDCLCVSIQQREVGPSQPFTWEGSAEQLPDGRIRVSIDFASQGAIMFKCNEITADKSEHR